MKKILIFGISSSLFIRDFCKEVFLHEEEKIVLLTRNYDDKYERDYAKYGVQQIEWPELFAQGIMKNCSFSLIKKYFRCISQLRIEADLNDEIEVMFIHYVEPLHNYYLLPLWKQAKKKILVFWGDDILRASKFTLKLMKYFLRSSSSIVFMIEQQYKYFQSQFGNRYDEKIQILDFGNSILEEIDNIEKKYTKEQCKEKFGLEKDKITVHVAYNAFRGQQHLEMIEGIAKYYEKVGIQEQLQHLEFVYHISYGQDRLFCSYRKTLEEIMDRMNMKYVFIEKYLQGEELAIFRNTCDIFLYGQKTDARSASPLEYIYAGANFICPRWLLENYEIVNNEDTVVYQYESFEELGKVFNTCIERFNASDGISDRGRRTIKEAISWEGLAIKWRALYE